MFEVEKFKRLVQYIAYTTSRTAGFGATKLNKVLWFADARMYMRRRKPITGATYIREKYGPVPKEMMPIRSELIREGKVKQTKERFYRQEAIRLTATQSPDMSIFTDEERREVDYWIKHIGEDHTAKSISDLTHEDTSWEIAKLGETLPYHAILATRTRRPRGKELEWAKTQVKQRDLF
jgi:hypothetical protein